MSPVPGVSDKEWNYLKKHFDRILPPNTILHLYGSRYRGNHQMYSDFDISIENDNTLDPMIFSALDDTFAESHITYKIDISEFQNLDELFQNHIRENGVTVKVGQ